ncbi:poly [ADP-ribose] polymerase tankyrase-2-like [Lytechinus variegatus]|uniref:poly [ADP-ribose] polymerase tankyrase-2-like n=1 Tax=Lytechinus variegatus TaxID=7654 RepID=UPI001BB15656|nr:poly [ADP-ribose] polymerase tankyrase-2-like [Lytechinus variegatus]
MSAQDVIDAINEGSTVDEIKHLIDEYNIDVDESVGELRLRAIHHSVFKDRLDCVKLFLSHGCDINARDQCGFTPLHIAARYNRADMANELITLGAHIDASDSLGCAPLHHALQKGHYNCSEVLLQHGAEANTFYKTIGYEIHALPGIYSDCLELLLSYGADPDARDTQGFVPLHHATRARNKLYVYILLKNGADPDVLTLTTAPELQGKTPLQLAIFAPCKSIVELLLLYGANPNCKDEHRNTPLHHVAARGHMEIAKLLIDHGAILTARNTLRYHPLHRACGAGATPEMIELLLENGAFVNSTTSLLETPAKCLLSHWQEVNEDINGNGAGGDGADVVMKGRDEQCFQQILRLLDYGARITVSTRQHDAFSIIKWLPSLSRMKLTRYLLLEASVDTRLLNPEDKMQVEYTSAEFQDVFSRATNPLSLRQACRRIIRKELGKRNLPEAVKQLQVPAILQSYLIFRSY